MMNSVGRAVNHLAARLAGFVGGQQRFLGDIAHERCSPLARMEVALSILEQRAELHQRGYVADVREKVRHMSELVGERLSFSKAGMWPAAVKLARIVLAQLVRQVAEREGAADNLTLELDEAPEVAANRELLARALANVIRNALRYAAEAGPVTITAARRDAQVRIVVSDSGLGVPKGELPKLFDPFYRLEPDRARNTDGVGLGLAIVKSCVEARGGLVTARNRTPSGLEITITLNAAD